MGNTAYGEWFDSQGFPFEKAWASRIRKIADKPEDFRKAWADTDGSMKATLATLKGKSDSTERAEVAPVPEWFRVFRTLMRESRYPTAPTKVLEILAQSKREARKAA